MRSLFVWKTPPQPIILNSKDVYIYRANLDLPVAQIQQLAHFLSPDEKIRAERFRFPEHQRRFVAARGILRELLSNYLELSPEQIVFEYSDRGKPKLPKSFNPQQLQFNLSHSQEMAVYCFTLNRRIGIDLEYLKPLTDAEAIASRFFATTEKEFIASAPQEEKQQIFFQLWTAKEAYLKATGEGLAGSLAEIEIILNKERIISSFKLQGSTTATKSWSLFKFIPDNNYIGTVAVENLSDTNNIQFWSWD
jgi:4'-phosphopantetheinyl transferase